MFPLGYSLQAFPVDSSLKPLVIQEQWPEVEQLFSRLTQPEGEIFRFLQQFHPFSSIEIMISIRNSENEWEEDGIWHDDGSRVFAFSLSLTEGASEIEGGQLELRKKNQEPSELIPTPEFGTAILFLTGVHGFEHRTRKVLKGKRMMLVGWCLE